MKNIELFKEDKKNEDIMNNNSGRIDAKRPEEIIGHELTKLYTEMKLDFWNKG